MRVRLIMHEAHAWIHVHCRKGMGFETQVCIEAGNAKKEGLQISDQVLIGTFLNSRELVNMRISFILLFVSTRSSS
jgi:hypothetical protein